MMGTWYWKSWSFSLKIRGISHFLFLPVEIALEEPAARLDQKLRDTALQCRSSGWHPYNNHSQGTQPLFNTNTEQVLVAGMIPKSRFTPALGSFPAVMEQRHLLLWTFWAIKHDLTQGQHVALKGVHCCEVDSSSDPWSHMLVFLIHFTKEKKKQNQPPISVLHVCNERSNLHMSSGKWKSSVSSTWTSSPKCKQAPCNPAQHNFMGYSSVPILVPKDGMSQVLAMAILLPRMLSPSPAAPSLPVHAPQASQSPSVHSPELSRHLLEWSRSQGGLGIPSPHTASILRLL